MRDFKPLILVVIIALCLVYTAQAQTTTYFSDHGTLTISPDSVSYEMGHRSAAFPNLALAELPRMNEYQYVSHDIALMVDDLERKGIEVRTPPNPMVDSLRAVADSMAVMLIGAGETIERLVVDSTFLANELVREQQKVVQLEEDLAAANESLAPLQAQVDSLQAEKAYAIQRMRDAMKAYRYRE